VHGADLELAVRLHATHRDALTNLSPQRHDIGRPDEIHRRRVLLQKNPAGTAG